jgi:hypothetical protein
MFIGLLQLKLSRPQRRHVQRIVDAVIVSDAPHKTLSALYALYVEAPDATNAADCLRISPWKARDIQEPLSDFVLRDLLAYAEAHGEQIIYVSIDDSLAEKDDATRHLEPVDYHHNHNQSRPGHSVYTNGVVYIEVRIQCGAWGYSYAHRLYLREKTVRRLNRQRPKGQRLRFRSKYRLAREMLVALQAQLPSAYQVYVLFDSWYASNKLLKFCRRQGWHVICALKANRTLDGKQVRQWNRELKHKWYDHVTVPTTDGQQREYLVRSVRGHLNHFADEVCVLISKRHPRERRPKYFLCTDLTLAPQAILRTYQKRWPIEVDNWYLKQALGLADFRVQSYAAVQKWFAIVYLALTYLQWRLQHADDIQHARTLADVIRVHRQEHAQQLLTAACELAAQLGQVQPVLKRFIRPLAKPKRA